MKQKIILLLLGFSFLMLKLNAQDSLAAVQMAAYRIAQTGTFQSEYVGFAAKRSPQYKELGLLVQYGGEKSLTDLVLSHPNHVVKLYAAMALKQKGLPIIEPAHKLLKESKENVQSMMGCVVQTMPVVSLYKMYVEGTDQIAL